MTTVITIHRDDVYFDKQYEDYLSVLTSRCIYLSILRYCLSSYHLKCCCLATVVEMISPLACLEDEVGRDKAPTALATRDKKIGVGTVS